MLESIESMMRKLPPPAPGKSANVACLLGLLFGGIGLGIYLKTVVDFVFPVALAVLASVIFGPEAGWVGGALVAGMYGYFRVHLAVDRPSDDQARAV